jgi:adenylate cyclase
VSEEGVERKLTAILAADVVGYSRLMGVDEAGTLARLKSLRKKLVQPKIAEGRGRIVKLMGDGLLAEFPSVVEAVRCAVDIQQDIAGRETHLPDERRIRLRIGVNLGDIIVEGSDIYGDGVNLAARLEGLAEPGGICISGKVYEEVRNKLPTAFEDLGKQEVKNIREPVRVYRWTDAAADPMPGMAGAEGALPLPDKPSIAVLPFTNMSGDPEQEYFADGITEDIITELSRFRELFVIARNSSFYYKGQSPKVQEISRELGVQYVVEGSVRKAGNRVRITAQLVEAESGNHVWAERYDRDLEDVFAVQDEIARTISASVMPEISHVEQESASRKPPQSLSAWEWYQRGLWHMHQFTLEEIVKAQHLFQRAIELDPNFAVAHSGIAYALLQEWMYDDSGGRRDILDQALDAAQTSAAIDDHDALAHYVLGRVQIRRGEFDIALAEAQKAVELNPSFAHAYLGLGDALMHLYRFEEALANFETAARLSPHDPHYWTFIHHQAWPLLALKRYEEAIKVERRALLNPNAGFYPYLPLISALGHLGREQEARKAIERLQDLQPGYSCSTTRRQLTVTDEFAKQIIDGLLKAGLPE